MSTEDYSRDVICEVFKSTKGGHKLFIDGYAYNKNKSKDGTFYWFCDSKPPCKATVITVVNEKGQHLLDKKSNNHHHDPEPLKKKIAEFKDKVKEIAFVSENLKLNDILQNARASVEGLPENVPSVKALRQMVYRQKCKNVPKIEEPLDTFFQVIDSETQISDVHFVLKDHVYDDNERLILMGTYSLILSLANSEYWLLDSLQIPCEGVFKYLHTLHGNIVNDKQITFPLLFCLTTQKNQVVFNKMFSLMADYALENQLVISPKICIIDFDTDLVLSLHNTFQNVQLHGCNFHLRQILFRKLQDLDFERKLATDINFNLEMKCVFALSHLTCEEIPRYYKKLEENLQDADSTMVAKWFAEEYIFGKDGTANFLPEFWSFKPHTNVPRCQDSAEAWHHHIRMFIIKHQPGFYALTKELIKQTLVHMHDIEKIMTEPPPSPLQKRPRKRKKKPDFDSRIDSIMYKKNISEVDLLKSIAKLLRL